MEKRGRRESQNAKRKNQVFGEMVKKHKNKSDESLDGNNDGHGWRDGHHGLKTKKDGTRVLKQLRRSELWLKGGGCGGTSALLLWLWLLLFWRWCCCCSVFDYDVMTIHTVRRYRGLKRRTEMYRRHRQHRQDTDKMLPNADTMTGYGYDGSARVRYYGCRLSGP